MTDKETLPLKAARKLNLLILQNEALAKNKSLQEKIIAWSLDMLEEARADWSDMHNAILDAVITCDRRKEAIRRGKARDNKYAQFRKYFKELQKQKFAEYQKLGKKMTANGFVGWFLENIPDEVIIPYKPSNQYNKLIKLAEENNRELKKNHA